MERIAILAGNPKVQLLPKNEIEVDPQLVAFEEAMKIVKECREQVAKIAIAFDHPGLFREQFLDPKLKLSNRRKKHLCLSYLDPKIRSEFEPVAADYGIDGEEISIISEDVMRSSILRQVLQEKEGSIYRRNCCENSSFCNVVNCRSITAAIVRKLAGNAEMVKTFWQYDPVRVKPITITQGTELAYSLFGVRSRIEQNIFVPAEDGKIYVKTTNFFPSGDKEVKIKGQPNRII